MEMEENIFESSSSTTGSEEFIREEDLVDTLFYACDIHGTGEVLASELVEKVRYITSGLSSEVRINRINNHIDQHKA